MLGYIILSVLLHPLLLMLFVDKSIMIKYIISILFPTVNLVLCLVIIGLVLSQRGEDGAFAKIISSQQTKTDSSTMMKQTILFGGIFVALFIPINQLIYLQKKLSVF